MVEFDLIILGGGTSGLPAAIQAAKRGVKKIALIEEAILGGTCLNYGCNPTKILAHSANTYQDVLESKRFGIEYSSVKINFQKVMNRMRSMVNMGRQENDNKINHLKNIHLFRAKGAFNNEIEVQVNGESLSAKKIFITSGARPFIPPLEGLDEIEYLTHRTILNLTELPKSLVIIGGGFISCEFASIFNSFGAKVSIIETSDRIMRVADIDISKVLHQAFIKDGINMHLGSRAKSVRQEKEKIEVILENGKKVEGEKLLIATGFIPNVENLNLKEAGIEQKARGYIKVNHYLETNKPGIWAFGDVIGERQYTHAALKESVIAVNNAFNKNKVHVQDKNIPYAVFTNLEIGSVGLTEQVLKENNIKYEAKKIELHKTHKGMILGLTQGLAKLLHDDKEILGCHIIGRNAGILVQEIIPLLNIENSLEAFRKTMHTHPTLSEIFDFLK